MSTYFLGASALIPLFDINLMRPPQHHTHPSVEILIVFLGENLCFQSITDFYVLICCFNNTLVHRISLKLFRVYFIADFIIEGEVIPCPMGEVIELKTFNILEVNTLHLDVLFIRVIQRILNV
jgi:hypothetical protein